MQHWLYVFSLDSRNHACLPNHYKYSPLNVPDLETTSFTTPVLFIMVMLN